MTVELAAKILRLIPSAEEIDSHCPSGVRVYAVSLPTDRNADNRNPMLILRFDTGHEDHQIFGIYRRNVPDEALQNPEWFYTVGTPHEVTPLAGTDLWPDIREMAANMGMSWALAHSKAGLPSCLPGVVISVNGEIEILGAEGVQNIDSFLQECLAVIQSGELMSVRRPDRPIVSSPLLEN